MWEPLKMIVREFAVKLAAIHRQKTQAYQGLRRGFLPKKRGKMRGKGMCAGFLEVPLIFTAVERPQRRQI
jgi:hypothetical protein